MVLGIQNNFFKTKISMKYDGVSLLGVIKGIFQHSSVKIWYHFYTFRLNWELKLASDYISLA